MAQPNTNLTYTKQGDYLFPNLVLDEQPEMPLGKYGMLRRTYLKEHRGGTYQAMLMKGTLSSHLQEIDQTANNRIELIMKQLLQSNPAPDKMKDQMGWVAHMESLHHMAEETVLTELVYI